MLVKIHVSYTFSDCEKSYTDMDVLESFGYTL